VKEDQLIMDAPAIARSLRSIAEKIVRTNAVLDVKSGPNGVPTESALTHLAVVGIYTRGIEIARRLAAEIGEVSGLGKVPQCGALDVSLHRDDLRQLPGIHSIQSTELPLNLDDCTVVLADDVFFTGRTARAALDALGAFGRPRRVQLAVLVDRGHRELPIRPDFVGRELTTSPSERVQVRLAGFAEEEDGVWLRPAL
jgi:pyrimidine operon attenuation protein/uracil phosphoribosyltransferase